MQSLRQDEDKHRPPHHISSSQPLPRLTLGAFFMVTINITCLTSYGPNGSLPLSTTMRIQKWLM
nr:MAG TPA: hypothetical protein [Caudoviricetes sp.]